MDPDQTAPIGLHCLFEWLLKQFSRQQKQTNFVVIGALRAKTIYYLLFSALSMQEALLFKQYNRQYITFNFKGKGNAQLQCFYEHKFTPFKVNIPYLSKQSLNWHVYLLAKLVTGRFPNMRL